MEPKKPGDRPLPTEIPVDADGNLRDLDKGREEKKYDVFPDDDGDADNRHDGNDDPV